MNEELQRKVDRAVKLIQAAGADGSVVEVAYSGGKDSDVILELTRMANIKYRAIYKNTTIDPPGTIAHAKENGVEIRQPKHRFFELVAMNGFPNRFARHCCRFIKEYKILDKNIMGVRKAESNKRKARYSEPTECRFYGSKKEHVEAFYPILDWTDDDVVAFIEERGIKCHALYYDEAGEFHPERRLGCMGCPIASRRKRVLQLKQYPNMIKMYCRQGEKYRQAHPNSPNIQMFPTVYDWLTFTLFCDSIGDFHQKFGTNLFGEAIDTKKYLEEYFNITL